MSKAITKYIVRDGNVLPKLFIDGKPLEPIMESDVVIEHDGRDLYKIPVPNDDLTGWKEGATDEQLSEFEEIEINKSLLPSAADVEKAKMTLTVIDVLTNLGVIE